MPIPAFVNASAGTADAAVAALESTGAFDVRRMEADGIGEAVRAAIAAGAERVVVAGGDGSVGAAAAALVGSDTALAVVPGGTLNHFVRDHGIPTDLEAAARVAVDGEPLPVDAARIGDRLFLNTASVGAYVRFVKTRERLEQRVGYRLASMLAAVRVLFSMRRYHVTIEVEGVARTYDTPLVFIGVGERELQLPTLGGRVADGRRGLHVLVVRTGRVRAVLALAMLAAARGMRVASSTWRLDAMMVERCRIDLPRRGVALAVDGEVVTMETPLEVRVERDAFRMVRAVGTKG